MSKFISKEEIFKIIAKSLSILLYKGSLTAPITLMNRLIKSIRITLIIFSDTAKNSRIIRSLLC